MAAYAADGMATPQPDVDEASVKPAEKNSSDSEILELIKIQNAAIEEADKIKNDADKEMAKTKIRAMFQAQIDKLCKESMAKTVDNESAGSSVVIPRKEHYRQEFRKQLAKEQVESQDAVDMMSRLRSLDFQMNEKKSEYNKGLKLYTVVASLITFLILMLSSAIIVVSAWEATGEKKDSKDRNHNHVVLIFSSLITLLTGILTYSSAEGKVALLRQAIKRIDALQTRIRVLTKYHFPETLSYGNAADELQRINTEYIEIQTSLALPCRVSEWGDYGCCCGALIAECSCQGAEDDVRDVRDEAYKRREERFMNHVYPSEESKYSQQVVELIQDRDKAIAAANKIADPNDKSATIDWIRGTYDKKVESAKRDVAAEFTGKEKYSIKVIELIQDRKKANEAAKEIKDEDERHNTLEWIDETYDGKIKMARNEAYRDSIREETDAGNIGTKMTELIKDRNKALAEAQKLDDSEADKNKMIKWIRKTYQAKMEEFKAEIEEHSEYEKKGCCCWASTKKKKKKEYAAADFGAPPAADVEDLPV